MQGGEEGGLGHPCMNVVLLWLMQLVTHAAIIAAIFVRLALALGYSSNITPNCMTWKLNTNTHLFFVCVLGPIRSVGES